MWWKKNKQNTQTIDLDAERERATRIMELLKEAEEDNKKEQKETEQIEETQG